MPTSTAVIIQALSEYELLNRTELKLARNWDGLGDVPGLVQSLVKRNLLTSYQGKQVLAGRIAGLKLGSYVILDHLGEGGAGHVLKCRQSKTGRLAAVKVLRKELVQDEDLVRRFLREIEVARGLPEHPHLVGIIGAGVFRGTYYLAMEYIAGDDLLTRVKRDGPLPITLACDYIRQAALGLQAIHDRQLVHRDIKPANLLVQAYDGSAGVVKLIDLGLARLAGQSGRAGRFAQPLTTDGTLTLGTVDYMAPEQALDVRAADIRADIYSLGCSLYFLLTGTPPFGDGPLAVKLMRHQQLDPPDPRTVRREISEPLRKLIQRCMAKNPADRWQTPGEVAAALAQLGSPSTPPGHRATLFFSGVSARARHWLGSQRSSTKMIAGCAAAGLVAAVAFWPSVPDNPKSIDDDRENLASIVQDPAPGGVESISPKQELPSKTSIKPSLASGQFVRIRHAGKGKVLSLAEVEVLQAGDNAPLHRKGKATQSSVGYGGVPQRAIDGNLNQAYTGNSITHTAKGDKAPWWLLDLGGIKDIGRIRIINRRDRLEGRLEGAILEILGKDQRKVVYTAKLKGVSKQELGGK